MNDHAPLSTPVPVNPEAWMATVRTAWRAEGHRLTAPRLRLLEAIVSYAAPFSAEQIYNDMHSAAAAPGRATVYRTLEQLHSAGWLARIHTQQGETGYVPCFPGHLHHMVCTGCGAVITFSGCALDELLARLAEQTHFAIEGHLLQLYGRCAACQARNGNKKPAAAEEPA